MATYYKYESYNRNIYKTVVNTKYRSTLSERKIEVNPMVVLGGVFQETGGTNESIGGNDQKVGSSNK